MNIELTEDEHRLLWVLLVRIAGDPKTSWRKHSDSLLAKVERHGRYGSSHAVLELEGQRMEFAPAGRHLTGTIMFSKL